MTQTTVPSTATGPSLSRRRFLQWSAVAGGTAGTFGLAGCGLVPQQAPTERVVEDTATSRSS